MAVKNAIKIDTAKNLGSQLINCAATMRQQISRLSEIQSQMVQMFDSTTSDYTLIEAQFGLQPGEGVILWGIVNGANTQIQADAAVLKLINWLINAN